ncbi:MAG: amino acid ABC transporter permease [Congregibacter sp.]
MNYTFQFGEVFAELPYLLGGALVTLQIVFIAFFVGAVLGLFGALGKVYGPPPVQRAIGAYVVFITNTPALVQIFVLYYALPDAGILLGSMTAVLLGLTLNSAAYLTEIIRAGVISVRQNEIDAALTINMGRLQILRHVLLPHIAKTIFPPLSNFFIWLMLGSSIAALFGVEELTGRAINISSVSLRTLETFAVVAVIYVGLTLMASAALALLGRFAFRVRGRFF